MHLESVDYSDSLLPCTYREYGFSTCLQDPVLYSVFEVLLGNNRRHYLGKLHICLEAD